jgi:hypothetical protein
MNRNPLSTPAWLLSGLFKSTHGTLELVKGLLIFRDETEIFFSAPLASLQEIHFPWYYLGAGVVFTVESKRYRLSFVEPGESGDIASGREACTRWKQRLIKDEG